MAKIRSLKDRLYKSPEIIREIEDKLKKLTDASNLPSYMGELFLSEIIASDDDANEHLRQRVVLLGLGEFV